MTKENISYSNPGKAEWMEIIQASLKQTSIEDFKWNTESGVSGLVFAHAEDLRFEAKSFAGMKDGNQWKVGMAFNAASALSPKIFQTLETSTTVAGGVFTATVPGCFAAQSAGIGSDNARFVLEHGRFLCDQHQLARLWR